MEQQTDSPTHGDVEEHPGSEEKHVEQHSPLDPLRSKAETDTPFIERSRMLFFLPGRSVCSLYTRMGAQ